MQGTRVRALVWEDPTCRGATKPMRHNYCVLQLLKPPRLELMLRNEKPLQWEARALQWREAPYLQQPEKACAQQKTQHSQK